MPTEVLTTNKSARREAIETAVNQMETSISRFLETAKHFKELIDQSEKRLKRMKELDKLSQRINKQDLYGKTPPGQLTPPNETILSDVFDRINAKLPGQAREVEQLNSSKTFSKNHALASLYYLLRNKY